jgi:hypothetical protein
MTWLTALVGQLTADATALRDVNLPNLHYVHGSPALTLGLVVAGLSLATLVAHLVARRAIGRNQVVVPTVFRAAGGNGFSVVRFLPLALFLGGLPFFYLALADPYTAMTRQEASYPGRRIALLLDASSSMMVPFPSSQLRTSSSNEATFLTTVAAAEAFVRHRASGKYRDLMALIEFGDEAYVVTPFTHDYDNVLLSMALVGDWSEFMQFPDGGTAIGRAIDRSVGLFKAFNFLDAAGNAMVIFSDGQDTQVTTQGKRIEEVLAAAIESKVPVFLIRTSRGKQLGDVLPDAIWKPAIEQTGGRFYAAATESDVIAAVGDIDRRAVGTIAVTHYAVQRPQFRPFAVVTAGFWALGILLTTVGRPFRKFP